MSIELNGKRIHKSTQPLNSHTLLQKAFIKALWRAASAS